MKGERLDKVLARLGLGSRKEVARLVRQGKVRVLGQVVKDPGFRVPEGAALEVEGRPLEVRRHLHVLLHKPPGFVTSRTEGPSVYALLQGFPTRDLSPVGRLDKDAEGLLLFTTDGLLLHRLTHPRFGVRKVYRVWTEGGTLPKEVCRRLLLGVDLEDGPARALACRPAPGGAVLVLAEGRKREVRRMLQRVGYPVRRLLRLQVGPIRLGDLPPGKWRRLSEREVKALLRLGGLE